MRLPEDNSLDLDASNDRLVIDRSDPPAPTVDDTLALLPGWARAQDAPMRDALAAAHRAMANHAWAATGHIIAALTSPRFAEGPWLDAWGALLKRPRAALEKDADYRARLLTIPAKVTPTAIRGALAALVALFPPVVLETFEPATDTMFAGSAASTWTTFAQPAAKRLWADDPSRPGAHTGVYLGVAGNLPEFWVGLSRCPDPDAGGAFAEPADHELPDFAMPAELPDNPGLLAFALPEDSDFEDFASPADPPATWDSALRFTASEDVVPGAWEAAFRWAQNTPVPLAERVIVETEDRRAGGVRWVLFVDPYLENAL